jgi:transposase-like protein
MANANSGFDINLSQVHNWLRVLSHSHSSLDQQKSCVAVKVEGEELQWQRESDEILEEESVVAPVSDREEE